VYDVVPDLESVQILEGDSPDGFPAFFLVLVQFAENIRFTVDAAVFETEACVKVRWNPVQSWKWFRALVCRVDFIGDEFGKFIHFFFRAADKDDREVPRTVF